MGAELGHDKSLPIESYFPKDVLPTGHFLSKLPGFDQEYPHMIPARKISSWNGRISINGTETVIRIGHVHGETRIMLDREIGQELWEIDEGRYSDVLMVAMKKAVVPVTVLLPDHVLRYQGPYDQYGLMRAMLYFKEELPIEKSPSKVQRPSELSLITESMFNLESSRITLKRGYNWGWGFSSIEQVFEALSVLKKAIAGADPIFTEDSPPNPSSNSLISEAYFPE